LILVFYIDKNEFRIILFYVIGLLLSLLLTNFVFVLKSYYTWSDIVWMNFIIQIKISTDFRSVSVS